MDAMMEYLAANLAVNVSELIRITRRKFTLVTTCLGVFPQDHFYPTTFVCMCLPACEIYDSSLTRCDV